MVGSQRNRTVRASGDHRAGQSAGMLDARHPVLEPDVASQRHDLLVAALPHHPGAVARILELLDQAGDVLLVAAGEQGVEYGAEQGEVLDALCSPVGSELAARDPPDLLRVGLEEGAVQPPSEPAGGPALEAGLVDRWAYAHPEVREHAQEGLDDAQVPQGVAGAQRVVVEAALVEDAAHPGADEEVVVVEDLVPEVGDDPTFVRSDGRRCRSASRRGPPSG